ncbi:MAG: hypothetical protein VXZ57_05355, partial [Bacteroidota bacterium]|nr:hypothetical protein [Bacteroidota bacterium]
MRHQWNTPIIADVGDIITLKISFRLSGSAFTSENDVFQLGLKSSLDASTSMTTGSQFESFTVELDANNHLGLKNQTDLASAEYQQTDWDTLTIKYFIGNTAQNSRIYAQLDNQGTKSGWMRETWNNNANGTALYDAIVSGSGAYLFFLSGNALTNQGNANHLHINRYDLWTDGSDTGLVMTGTNTTWNSHSSTGSKPETSTDRIFIFDQDANYSGAYGRNWAYLFVDSGASFDWSPSSATNLTLASADIYGTLQSTTTAGTVTVTNLDIESGGTFDFPDAGSFTSSNLNVAGTLNVSTSGDITSTTSSISGSVNISGADNVTLTNLSFGASSGNVDFTSSSFTEGKVKVSESTTYATTTTFDDNFTLDSSTELSVAPGGFLLKRSSFYNGFDTSAFWSKYVDSETGWTTITGTFPDDASFDYSNSNLIYNSQAYGNAGLKVNGEVGDFDFNNIYILDGKRMVINGTSISAENIIIEDTTDPISIVMYGGAIKATNPFSCNVQYHRFLDVDRWYGIASPVSGQDIDEFIADEDLAVSSNISAVGLANYVNDASLYDGPSEFAPVDTGFWDYYEAGQSDSGDFAVGEGKIVRLASDASDQQITFKGEVNNGDFNIAISSNTTGFNFVANPYLSPININSAADATNNVLSLNESSLTEMTAWLWNGGMDNGVGGYTAYNQNPSEVAKVAPIRAFFVSAAASGTFSLTTGLQADGTVGSFNRQTEWSKIDLSMSAGTQSSETEIVYFDGATTGWDNGYDSTNWSSGSFQIFTSHVDTSTSQNLAIQSLPLGNFNDMVVPVGVNASA